MKRKGKSHGCTKKEKEREREFGKKKLKKEKNIKDWCGRKVKNRMNIPITSFELTEYSWHLLSFHFTPLLSLDDYK